MPNNDYPRLCGGTFFTLLLEAVAQRKRAREHIKGEGDGLTNPEVFAGLLKVVNPDYEPPKDLKTALKSAANTYKKCEKGEGPYIPLGNSQEVAAFDARVKSDYGAALKAMVDFVEHYLDLGEEVNKKQILVRRLLGLIDEDEHIDSEAEFFALPDGCPIKKEDLLAMKEFCYPAFLLGVWHYALTNENARDNKIGAKTYETWCPENGGGPRKFNSDIGSRIDPNIRVYVEVPDIAAKEHPDVEECYSTEDFSEHEEQSAGETPTLQQVNNPFVFNFTHNGDGGTQIGYIANQVIKK